MLEDQDAKFTELNALWNTQESLLQSYRSIFVTAQSIVFAVAVTIASTDQPWLALLLAVPGMYMMSMWTGICRSRARDVSFVQWLMLKLERGEAVGPVINSFKEYQRSKTYNGTNVLEDEEYREMINSMTRRKMEVILPRIFWVMWILLVVYIVVRTVPAVRAIVESA